MTGIDPDGLWAERGLELGDIILEIGGKPVKTPAETENALREARSAGKRTVLLRLKSGDAMRFLTAPVGFSPDILCCSNSGRTAWQAGNAVVIAGDSR